MAVVCTPAERKGPLRWHPFPEPPETGQTPFGRRNPELGRLSEAEKAKIYLSSSAWRSKAKPILDALDEDRDRRGRKLEWTAEEKERVLFYGRMCGFAVTAIPKILKALKGDRKARQALGFTKPRQGRRGEPTEIDAFIPSVSTMRAHLRKLGAEQRARMYEAVEQALLDEYLAIQEVRQNLRQFNMDGFPIRTHFTAPVYKKRRRACDPKILVNEGRITAPDGGYRAGTTQKQGGHGWETVPIMTTDGVCLARATGRLNEEQDLAYQVIEKFTEQVTPLLHPDELNVLTADGLFNHSKLRFRCRDAGLVENIHFVSHKDESADRADEFDRRRYPLVHPSKPAYANWFVNGHRELVCSCGKGRTETSAKCHKAKIVLAVVGRCSTCGNVRVKSGRWRMAKNPARFVLCQPGEYDQADLALGNPLTYSDARAEGYGEDRFGHNEGGFGTLRNLGLDEVTWFRSRAQVEADLAISFGAMNALAIEKHRRAALAAPAPPELTAA